MTTTRPRKIFLDANVVIRAGKPPGGPLMPRVADLVEAGYVKVVTTDLTKMEIAKKHAGNDFETIGDLTKRRVRELAAEMFGVELPAISPADLHRKLLEKYQASVEQMFKSLRAETLSIDSVKPSVVFDAYPRRRPHREDKVLLPHHTVEGEKNIDVEADFSMTLKVDRHGKPKSIAEFSFDDDNFAWVSIGPTDYDYK